MGQSKPHPEQFADLLAALCDGEITREEAAELERIVTESPAAREHFVRYLQMHGEICWAAGHGVGDDAAAAAPLLRPVPVGEASAGNPVFRPRSRKSSRKRLQWAAAASAVAAAVVVGALGGYLFFGGDQVKVPTVAPRPTVATLERTSRAQWSADVEAPQSGEQLRAGRRLVLEQGLAEIRFASGATVVLEGPADFHAETINRATLRSGRLVARVPHQAAGFTVGTPCAKVVDRGTELGIVVQRTGTSDVHVFEGKVELQAVDAGRPGSLPMTLTAGRTVRVQLGADGLPLVTDLNVAADRFVRTMPPPGPSARLRALVTAHPQLSHYYTFEGGTPPRKHLDRRGRFRLEKVVMVGGDGSGDVYELAPGIDVESNAVRPYRSPEGGNTIGVALKTQAALPPEQAMTIEVLLKLEKADGWQSGDVCTAVSLCDADEGLGCSIAATEGGRLACRLGPAGAWEVTDLALVPGDWYYVATTFRAEAGQTRLDCFAANLTLKQPELAGVLSGRRCPAKTPAGRVGIGTGFAEDGQAAGPWQGILDEVAIYKAALSEKVLQTHLEALLGPP